MNTQNSLHITLGANRSPSTRARKRRNHTINRANRAETNAWRSRNPSTNPTWHGLGNHAGLNNLRKTKVKGGRRNARRQAEREANLL